MLSANSVYPRFNLIVEEEEEEEEVDCCWFVMSLSGNNDIEDDFDVNEEGFSDDVFVDC